jgi:hypothetical protein
MYTVLFVYIVSALNVDGVRPTDVIVEGLT